jgi:hypothetical protein
LAQTQTKTKRKPAATTGKTEKQSNAKSKLRTRAQELNDAYNAGYASGWDDCKVCKTAGTRQAATTGYNNGVKAHKKTDKALNRVQKGRAVKK